MFLLCRESLVEAISVHSLECSEMLIFLISAAMYFIIEYTNESLIQKGMSVLTAQEFRKFMGTLLLTSAFNTSVSTTWELMTAITVEQVMIHERFETKRA
jgi:hypothetical protein